MAENDEIIFEVLMPIKLLPEGSTFTKKTGQLEFILKDKLIVYGESGIQQTINNDGSSRFGVDEMGRITAFSGDTIVRWLVSVDELHQYIEDNYISYQ